MKKTTLLFLFLFGIVASAFSQSGLCDQAVSISLPYSTTDDTANYGNLYNGVPGTYSSCGTPNNFLSGNDVVYAYTATIDGTINIHLSTDSSYVGLFAYGSCANIGQECLAGVVMEDVNSPGYLSIEAFPVTNGSTYYFLISTWAEPQTAAFHLNIAENTCTNPTATYTVVSDCSVTDQYVVDVKITNLGSATSLTISDNQGNPTQNITAAGTVTFGPYPNGTPATFTIANDQDTNCFITSAPQNQIICAPLNNFCTTAIDLGQETSPVFGTTVGATSQNTTSCATNRAAGDVYYSIVVPNTYSLTIAATAADYDAMVSLYYGNCDNLIELTCFDDDFETYHYTNNTGTEQTFYWVQDGFNGQTGTFTLEWSLDNCVVPEALYTVVPDCINGEQFLVTADVYTLGSATSVTVSDDQGSTSQTVTETGQLQFGPYANGTQVNFTATNDDDADCFLMSQTITQLDCPPTCTNAAVNFEVVLNCPATGFVVNANVTDLGTATSVSIIDNQGGEAQTISAAGQLQFGPYADYTSIIFTVSDNDDSDCVFTTEVTSFSVCPPSNDNCAAAIAIIPGSDLPSGSMVVTNAGGTVSPELPIPSCGNMFFTSFAKDIWYTVTVPPSGNITIETAASDEGSLSVVTDTVLQVYSGNCSGLTPIVCDNDGGADAYAKISLTGQTAGEVLYIRAFGAWGVQGSFLISAYDASLVNHNFDASAFSAYPNPVKNILNLSYSKNITNVHVFNLLGQEVIAKPVNNKQSQIDVSHLPKGTYLVKVFADNEMKTVKVIKE